MSRSVYVPRDALCVAYRALDPEDDYDDFLHVTEGLRDAAIGQWPSLHTASGWVDREGCILAENRLVRFGFSHYCGLLAVWMIAQDDTPIALVEHWAAQIEPRFNDLFGELRHVATFSNGEAIYERIAP